MDTQISSPNILLIGAGSVGAVYVYQLQKAGCKVTTLCRSNYATIKERGFKLLSVRFGDVTYRPDRTIRSISECADEIFDYILVCTKSLPDSRPSLTEMLREVIRSKKTAIILAQNGILIEEPVAEAFPENPILSGVIYLPTTEIEPGTVTYREMLNLLELGTYPADAPPDHKAAAVNFAELMIKGGGEAKVLEDVQVARWSKLLMNAAWNPICALTMCSDGDFLQSSEFAEEMTLEVMKEIVALAVKIGIPGITIEEAEKRMDLARDRARRGAGREMSMLHDVRQGRLFEVEAIVGNVVRLGRTHGIKMPRLETLYALLKGRYEAQLRERIQKSTSN